MPEKKPKVLVLRTAGTNCDSETMFAFASLGAEVESVHINRLLKGAVKLERFHILAIPGGFTYGDDIISGRILANELRLKLGKEIERFVNDGKLIIGICNGFQVLVRAGLLPGPLKETRTPGVSFEQTASLTYNDSGKFEDRWVHLRLSGNCVWTADLKDIVYIPVAHAEGKFVAQDVEMLNQLEVNQQIVFRYCSGFGGEPQYPDNPNGSVDNIAGICDRTGRILGLMPHPERHFLYTQHPFWTRLNKNGSMGDGARIFENGINYVKDKLLN